MQQRLISIFNNQIFEIIEQISNAFPNVLQNDSIKETINSFETTSSFSPHLPIELFYINIVEKFDAEIIARNEEFLLTKLSCEKNDPLHLLKNVYIEASIPNKKIIWDYVERLRILSIKYYQHQIITNEKIKQT